LDTACTASGATRSTWSTVWVGSRPPPSSSTGEGQSSADLARRVHCSIHSRCAVQGNAGAISPGLGWRPGVRARRDAPVSRVHSATSQLSMSPISWSRISASSSVTTADPSRHPRRRFGRPGRPPTPAHFPPGRPWYCRDFARASTLPPGRSLLRLPCPSPQSSRAPLRAGRRFDRIRL
jgi:hypothetical protein